MMHSKLLMAGAGALRLLERLCRPIHAWFDGCFDRLAMDKRQREQRGFEVDSDDAIVQQEPLRARGLQKAICFVFAIALIWAAFSDVDEVARGEGKVIPSRQLQVIQSLDGGVVSEIRVKEGEIVEPEQILLRIDQTRYESSVRESRAQYTSLFAKAARLRALTEGVPFNVPDEVLRDDPKTIEEERRLYESRRNELDTSLSIARQQVTQRQQELVEMRAKYEQAAKAYEISSRELLVTKPLIGSGAVSEVELLRLERDVSRFRGERDMAAAQISRIQAAIAEANHKLHEVGIAFRNESGKELAETMSRLNANAEGSVGLADKVTRSVLRSPVKGTVKRLLVNTVGGVVQPGTLTGTAAINGTGNALDNTLVGNSAASTLSGGTGDDTYFINSTGDIVVENANDGNDYVVSSVSYTLGANVERLSLIGTAAINGTGNALDNTIFGNSAANILKVERLPVATQDERSDEAKDDAGAKQRGDQHGGAVP